jgi:hypothetical protein
MADEQDYVRGGKGRKDEIGRTGIHPASAGQIPDEAEIIGQEDLGHRTPGREAPMPLNNSENQENNKK